MVDANYSLKELCFFFFVEGTNKFERVCVSI